MAWHKLTVGNDWGRRYVLMGEKHMSASGCWGIQDETTPVLDKDGVYLFKLANGTEDVMTVRMVHYDDSVGDMGHTDHFRQHEAHLVMKHHGMEFTLPVQAVEDLSIWRDEGDLPSDYSDGS